MSGYRKIVFGMMILVVAFLSACGKPDSTDMKLILISPHQESISREMGNGFKKWYKAKHGVDVELEWLDQGGTTNIMTYIKSEFKRRPDGINIDMFFGGGTDPYLNLKKMGLLQPYRLPDEILSKVAKEYAGSPIYDPDFYWYGACLSGFGIIYNKEQIALNKLPEPKTWADLARPELMGWVSSADPRQSGSVHKMYEIILQSYGWEKGFAVITKMDANVKGFKRGAGDIPRDVDLGETAYGLAIDIYASAKIAEAGSDRLGYMMPENETVINPDSIAILKGAPHKELAQSFLEFVIGEPGQKLWMKKMGEPEGPKEFNLRRMSVMPHMYDIVDVPVNPFKMNVTLRYDHEKGTARWHIVPDLIGSMTIDMHDELKDAWKAIQEGGMKDEAIKRLVAVPISEEEAARLGKEKWDDPEFRNAKITEWTIFAQDKYKDAIKLAK